MAALSSIDEAKAAKVSLSFGRNLAPNLVNLLNRQTFYQNADYDLQLANISP